MIGGPINLVCLLLGATIFLSNIFIGLICLGYLVFLLVNNGARIRGPFSTAALMAAAWCALIVVIVLLPSDIPGIIFWNIGVNRPMDFNVAHQLAWAPIVHLTSIAPRSMPFGANLFHLVGATILFSIAYASCVRPRRWWSVVAFVVVALIFALLSQWRSYDNYKGAMPFGISWAFVIASLGIASSRIRSSLSSSLPSIESSPWFAAGLIVVYGMLAIYSPGFARAVVSYSVQRAPRPATYEEAQVCRFGERQNCRCLQSTAFSPQEFLGKDVMPCRNRYPGWASLLGKVRATREWMVSDSRNPGVVFEVYSRERMQRDNVPIEAITYWETETACTELIPGESRLCFAR